MHEQYQVESVTAILADADTALGKMVYDVAGMDSGVSLCAAVQSGQQVLELLNAGLRPQVLVLDTMLPDGFLALLRRLPTVDPHYKPYILVSTVAMASVQLQRLLTLGVDSYILKPYTLQDLFDHIIVGACGQVQLQYHQIRGCVRDMLRELRLDIFSRGAAYLVPMVASLLLEEQPCTMKELYALAGEQEQQSCDAVVSAIRRMAERAWQNQAPLYGTLCITCGKAADAHLTAKEFVHGLAESMRHLISP